MNLPKKKTAPSASQRKAAQKEATRMALLEAAGRVIGKYGYTGCSIARVTAKAKIGHGCFYIYFPSQEFMFQEVRTVLGQKMQSAVYSNIFGETSIRELEEQYIRSSIAYYKRHPYMWAVMVTSEQAGARRDAAHLKDRVDRYVERLRPLLGPSFSDDYLTALTVMIMGVRSNILHAYKNSETGISSPPEEVIQFYLNFIAAGAAAPENVRTPSWSLAAAPPAPLPIRT